MLPFGGLRVGQHYSVRRHASQTNDDRQGGGESALGQSWLVGSNRRQKCPSRIGIPCKNQGKEYSADITTIWQSFHRHTKDGLPAPAVVIPSAATADRPCLPRIQSCLVGPALLKRSCGKAIPLRKSRQKRRQGSPALWGISPPD